VAQPSGVSTAITTNQSSGNAGNAVSSITIAEGSAAQQVRVNYQPNPAGVVSGSKITWTNKDIAPHTATSGLSSSATDSGKIFDTGLISPGSAGSAVVSGNGKIPYHCTFHPWMTGVTQISTSNQTQAGGSLQNNASTDPSQPTRTITVPTVNDSNLKVVQVISNLSMPTTMAFLGPDDFLMLQK
jgi:plastocyanin